MQTFLPYPGFASSAAVLDRQRLGKRGFLPSAVVTMLACPIAGCGHYEEVSEEDPGSTLSAMLEHLCGYFRGQHRLSMDDAMAQLAKVREVRRD